MKIKKMPSSFYRNLLGVVLLLFGHYSFAAATTTITGHVTDASGKSIKCNSQRKRQKHHHPNR